MKGSTPISTYMHAILILQLRHILFIILWITVSLASLFRYILCTRQVRVTITKRGLLVVEIIVALIAVFGGVLPYLLQRNKELNLKIADQKREAYASFLTNFTKVSVAVTYDEDVSGKEVDLERLLARDQLLLYASDDVIKAYDAWIRYADNEKHDYKKEGELHSLV